MTRKCPKCQKDKDFKYFDKDIHNKSGYSCYCKDCKKVYFSLNREKILESKKKHYQNNRDRRIAMARAWQDKNKTTVKNTSRKCSLKRLYGLTTEDYSIMLKKQNNCCAICLKHQDEFKNKLSIDHNHVTNKIRGLLCSTCNLAIGCFYVDVSSDNLVRAIMYINAASKEEQNQDGSVK